MSEIKLYIVKIKRIVLAKNEVDAINEFRGRVQEADASTFEVKEDKS